MRRNSARTLTTMAFVAVALTAACHAAETPAKPVAAQPAKPAETAKPQNEATLNWWRESRFGMFIHWGPVSLKGTEIGWSRGAQIPIPEYDNLYKQFNPTRFNADEWVSIAKAAGMRYIVFTTKHHDGFCMFDTKATDYNIMNSPFARDVVKELAEACRRQGIRFGTYHSVCDWHHPAFPLGSPGGRTPKPNPNLDAYTEYLKQQVTELIRNYGPLHTMWFDVPQGFDAKRGQGVIDLVRKLQPDILINNRCANPADYDTPEQRVGTFRIDRPWETCMTICRQWAWKPNDQLKTLKECLQNLVLCAGGDGNLLFNVGPMPTGEIEGRQVDRLKEMGAWLRQYGETIYGTRGGPYKPNKAVATTRKGNAVYLHVLRWDTDTLVLPPLPKKIVGNQVLTGGTATVTQNEQGVTVAVPAANRQEIDTIIRLDLDGPAMEIAPIALAAPDNKATASNVYQDNEEYAADKAFDGEAQTRWATDAGTKTAWLQRDLGKPTTFSQVTILEAYAGRVQKFELQYRDGDAWKTIFAGTTLGERFNRKFDPVTAQHVRLNILEATDGPTIWEFQVGK